MKHLVIIPSYNRPRYIVEAIRSCLESNSESEIQVIVADDGSNEGTLNAIRSVKDPRVTLDELDEDPGLPRGARRSCLAIHRVLVKIPWIDEQLLIHYLPDDDVMVPGRFMRFTQYFENHPDALWAYGPLALMDADGTNVRLADLPRGKPLAEPNCAVDVASVAHRPMLLPLAYWGEEDIDHEGALFQKWAKAVGPLPALSATFPVAAHRRHDYNLIYLGDKVGELPRE